MVYFLLFDNLCSLCRLCPVSPEDRGEEPLAELLADALSGAQPGAGVASQVGAVQTEGQAAQYQPLEGEAGNITLRW